MWRLNSEERFCSFAGEFIEERKKRYIQNAEKNSLEEYGRVEKFFEFLEKEKGVGSFDESFFDKDRVKTVEDFFKSLEDERLLSSCIITIGNAITSFFDFCLKKRHGINENEWRKENAERVFIFTKRQCVKMQDNKEQKEKDAPENNNEILHEHSLYARDFECVEGANVKKDLKVETDLKMKEEMSSEKISGPLEFATDHFDLENALEVTVSFFF